MWLHSVPHAVLGLCPFELHFAAKPHSRNHQTILERGSDDAIKANLRTFARRLLRYKALEEARLTVTAVSRLRQRCFLSASAILPVSAAASVPRICLLSSPSAAADHEGIK